jgi:hypothetical protein
MLDDHYADGVEVAAVLVVGASVFVPLVLGNALALWTDAARDTAVAIAVGTGLLTGRPSRAR